MTAHLLYPDSVIDAQATEVNTPGENSYIYGTELLKYKTEYVSGTAKIKSRKINSGMMLHFKKGATFKQKLKSWSEGLSETKGMDI